MAFKMDNNYRSTDEYKLLMKQIREMAPWLPDYLCEVIIIADKTNPDAFKKDKEGKKILKMDLKPPKYKGEVTLDNVLIGELTPEIEKQREEFWEKHTPKQEQSALPTIEEVEVK